MPQRANIIIASLDRRLRSALRVQLDELGFTAVVAKDAAEAVDLATYQTPSLLILDTDLPVLGAYDACARIRHLPHCRYVPILLMAGTDQPKIRAAAERAGATSLLIRPFSENELLRKLELLLPATPEPDGPVERPDVGVSQEFRPTVMSEPPQKVWTPTPLKESRRSDGSTLTQGIEMLSIMRQRESRRRP